MQAPHAHLPHSYTQAPASISDASVSKTLKPAAPPLLGIDARNLRGDSELRRIFGGDVVASVDRSDAAEAGGAAGMVSGVLSKWSEAYVIQVL